MKLNFKPRLILVVDRNGEILYPVRLMRDELGISQRAVTRQATRETSPRDVTPKIRPLVPAPKAPNGWLARLMARLF